MSILFKLFSKETKINTAAHEATKALKTELKTLFKYPESKVYYELGTLFRLWGFIDLYAHYYHVKDDRDCEKVCAMVFNELFGLDKGIKMLKQLIKFQKDPKLKEEQEKEFKKSLEEIPLGTPASAFVEGREGAAYQIKTGNGVLGAYFNSRLE
tara:strand:+ start:50 stop:511 length:462 start_codon:yes stop_codon:yes gene_type:complete